MSSFINLRTVVPKFKTACLQDQTVEPSKYLLDEVYWGLGVAVLAGREISPEFSPILIVNRTDAMLSYA